MLHEEHDSNEPVDTSKGYEAKDLKPAVLVWGIALTALIVIAATILMKLFADAMGTTPSVSGDTRPTSVAVDTPPLTVPSPRLQANPEADLETLATLEQDVQSHYGWVDQEQWKIFVPENKTTVDLRQTTVSVTEETPPPWLNKNNADVVVPIEEAMKYVAENGLPQWESPSSPSGSSNSQ